MSKKHKRKRSRKAGLPPGTLIHIGDEREEQVSIKVIRFDAAGVIEKEAKTTVDCRHADDGKITWINVCGVHNPEIIGKIGDVFKIHPLIQEDIMDTDHRPKIDDNGDLVFIILKHFGCDGKCDIANEEELKVRQVSIVLGYQYIISFQEVDEGLFKPVIDRLRNNTGKFYEMGPGYLAYSLMDIIVDNYFTVLEKLDDAINVIEDESVEYHNVDMMRRIQDLRKKVITVRRAAWPVREVLARMERMITPLIPESSAIYIKDVYDHIVQVMDTAETFREILSNLFDIYLSNANNRMNEIMKLLTIISTIILPMSFIASLYGMNFKFMPETRWHFGYPMALCLMLGIAGGFLYYFRKRKWL